jgi:hypothetical protein
MLARNVQLNVQASRPGRVGTCCAKTEPNQKVALLLVKKKSCIATMDRKMSVHLVRVDLTAQRPT